MRFCVRLLFDLQFASVGLPMSQNIKASTYNNKYMKKTQNLTFFSILEINKSQIKKKTILWILTNTYLSL